MIMVYKGWHFRHEFSKLFENGTHGYSNFDSDMQAIFFARGPVFDQDKGKIYDTFENVEIYDLICNLLKIKPSPNNGTGIFNRYF